MDIRECIANLLTQHDCVIIPGFGGFIGNYAPARIDPVQHIFYPPSKKLLFNIQLKQNDGLLVNAVALAFGITYSEAGRMVEQFADDCRTSLHAGDPVSITGVGQLFTGHEDIIYFDQDPSSNLLPETFGLQRVISPPVSRTHEPDLRLPVSPVSMPHSHAARRLLPRVMRWAALFALPIGLAAMVGMLKYNRISQDYQSNAGIISPSVTMPVVRTHVEKKSDPIVVSPPLQTSAEVTAGAKPGTEITDDKYAIIVGAFRIHENADKLVEELIRQGFQAAIYDQSKTGLFRVSIGTRPDRAGAHELLATARSARFGGAWILAK